MNTHPLCDETTRRSSAERYVTRRMDAPEAEAYENHYLTCAGCQSELRFASAVGALLRQPPADSPRARSRRPWIWGGLAIAAGVTAVMVLNGRPRGDYAALGGVTEPPVYLGIPVRSGGATQDSLFEAAMVSYAERRYSAAVTGLRATLAAGEDSVPTQFFLAASLLLDNRPGDAADEFQRVIGHGETPYRNEATYYRAKALLRMGRAADAQIELARLRPTDGVMFELGKALGDSIARLLRR